MGDQRDGGIAWTDETWNPVRGCSRVSEGCRHCYAEAMAGRFCGEGEPYEGLATKRPARWTGKVRLVPEHLGDPLKWRRSRKVFVNSMSDLFHDGLTNEEIAAVFGVMATRPDVIFQVLTKRAPRMRQWFEWITLRGDVVGQHLACRYIATEAGLWLPMGYPEEHVWPLPNVWLGVSVEDQGAADKRIPDLLECSAAVRWVSVEPMLGRIDFARVGLRRTDNGGGMQSWAKIDALHGAGFVQTWGGPWIWNGLRGPHLDWVVCGGESGPHARPFDLAWARSLRDQCGAAGVPFFMKQLCDDKGRSLPFDTFPSDLQVRQWPGEVTT